MAPIVAPGVCRFTVNGSYSEQPTANIIDMFIDTTGSIESRAEACFSQAGIILNEWTDSVLPRLSVYYEARSVSYVDLNSLDGSTGERATTSQDTWPQPGLVSGAGSSGNVAYRVNKETQPARGRRQGRMYLPGVNEGATESALPNEITEATQDLFATALTAFLGDIEQAQGGVVDYSSHMVVVHTVEGVFDSQTRVDALTLDGRVGSQRRRLDL